MKQTIAQDNSQKPSANSEKQCVPDGAINKDGNATSDSRKGFNNELEEIEKEIEILEDPNSKSITWSDYINHRELQARKSQLLKDKARFEEFVKKLRENIWKNPSTFEGIKCKTCLPLDYVEDEIDKLLAEKMEKE